MSATIIAFPRPHRRIARIEQGNAILAMAGALLPMLDAAYAALKAGDIAAADDCLGAILLIEPPDGAPDEALAWRESHLDALSRAITAAETRMHATGQIT